MLADSSLVRASLSGVVSIKFTSDQDTDCTLKLQKVIYIKGLEDEEGTPTTPYYIVNHRKPRIGKFHVFGCPCAFKRYQPHYQNKVITKKIQLQRGSRGVFCGISIKPRRISNLYRDPNKRQTPNNITGCRI